MKRIVGKLWTEDDLTFLRENWQRMEHAEIAARLGRTRHAVRSKCSKLGLIEFRPWTDDERVAVREWYEAREGRPLELYVLAAGLGRTKTTVCKLAREMGLTDPSRKNDHTPESKKRGGASLSQRWAEVGHPRGMLGKKQSAESTARSVAGRANRRALMSAEQASEIALRAVATRIEKYGRAVPVNAEHAYSRAKRGRRADIGTMFFRSRWEANYARFLNLLKAQGQITEWAYEPDTFWFEAIRRGIRSYTPDFKVWERSGAAYYVEVKGWMDPKSKTKLKRMKKYHPHVDLRVFGQKAYRELERKLGAAIPGWEAAA